MSDKITRTFNVTVKSGDHVQTHEVQGTGVSQHAAWSNAIQQIAQAFPLEEGHVITGTKLVEGGAS